MKNVKRNRRITAAAVATLMVAGGVTACASTGTPAPAVGQNVHSVNQLEDQNVNETLTAYNVALKSVQDQYPASQMTDPLELQMLRERDLYLNATSNILYLYIFPSGRNEVFYSTVRGKVSSMASEMTATDGIYKNNSSSASDKDSQSVPIPQDDLSFGGTEFGDNGIFWFDEQGGFHEAGTAGATVMIESAPLTLNAIKLPAQPMDPKILQQMTKK